MQLRFGLFFALSALSLSGCTMIGINNGSLDYKHTKTQKALEYPENTLVRPATPLYPAPIIEGLALQHAPELENKRGNRFALPRPEQAQINPQAVVVESNEIGAPQLVKDGNGNPLIKIDGKSATIWQYTVATMNSLNHPLINANKNGTEASFNVGESTYVVKLTSVGTSNNIAVFNTDGSFADPEKAADLLAQIYQNWPA